MSAFVALEGVSHAYGGATDEPAVHEVPQSADEVEHYWTDERMDAARAREQQLPRPGGDDG